MITAGTDNQETFSTTTTRLFAAPEIKTNNHLRRGPSDKVESDSKHLRTPIQCTSYLERAAGLQIT